MSALEQEDRERSYTARMLPELRAVLRRLPRDGSVRRLLDVGCGHGGLTTVVATQIGAIDVCGIDIDAVAVAGAARKGVRSRQWDLSQLPLPYDSGAFDLVTSFGVLNYMPTFDGVLEEVHRVLRHKGYLIVALPNLLSWHNRFLMVRGFHPRDVEISSRILAGVHPRYRHQAPVGHVAGVSTTAFEEVANDIGFAKVAVLGAAPLTSAASRFARVIDRLTARRPTLARRFVFCGQKVTPLLKAPRAPQSLGWWQEVQTASGGASEPTRAAAPFVQDA